MYGNDRSDSFYQTGIKYMLYRENIQFNASYGNRLNQTKDDSFFSVGLVFVSNPFLNENKIKKAHLLMGFF